MIKVIGYRVVTVNGFYVNANGEVGPKVSDCVDNAVDADGNPTNAPVHPAPMPVAQAYAAVSAYMSANPSSALPKMCEVTRLRTPLESTSGELARRLTDLCRYHGLTLGMSQDAIEEQIANELRAFGVKD